MKSKFLIAISLLCSSVSFWSCTDLDETYYDQVAPEKVPSAALVQSIYNTLKGDFNASPKYCPFFLYLYDIQVSTDELAMPVCGSQRNWYDKGIYIQMQQHNWNPSNPIFESAWSYCYKIVSTCNDMLAHAEDYSLDDQAIAECRLLRAYAYYRLMDLFGNVPLIKEDHKGTTAPANSTRKEVFEFVERELNDKVMESLLDRRYAKMDKGVWHTLKARLYLNSKVFLGLDDESAEYKAYLEKCIAECDEVSKLGYSIEPNIYKNFYFDNGPKSSNENIFVIDYNNDGSTLGNRTQMSSYYKTQNLVFGGQMYQHTTGGYKLNPGKTADDLNATFNLFTKNDNRRLSLLWGQQYDKSGKKIVDEENSKVYFELGMKNPKRDTINYRPFFKGGMDDTYLKERDLYYVARNGDGARIIKFELEADPKDYESGVDMVIMRYAEVLYMKAECLIRLGRNTEAVPLFREVLSHRGYDYQTVNAEYDYDFAKDEGKNAKWACALMSKRWLNPTDLASYDDFKIPDSPDREFMDQELRREFLFEDHRRTDMIRMGKFLTGTWGGHLTPTGEKSGKEIFPIPEIVLSQNPNLKQNPAYLGK